MKQPNILFLLSDEHGFRYLSHVSEKEGGEPVSTPNLFGRGCQEPVQDDALKEPSNIYGQTKLACEHLLRFYA